MISVVIEINGRQIFKQNARRISGRPGEKCIYQAESESGEGLIKHHYDDGAVVLAVKMLKLILRHREKREG